jgi:hypothetical protein
MKAWSLLSQIDVTFLYLIQNSTDLAVLIHVKRIMSLLLAARHQGESAAHTVVWAFFSPVLCVPLILRGALLSHIES